METVDFTLAVNLPSPEEFAAKYKAYGRYSQDVGKPLFDLVMTPESFICAQVVTESLGLPAVAGVAKSCLPFVDQQVEKSKKDFTKQYIGALVCTLMEANGFEKTGEKRAIPVAGFTKGEVYCRQSGTMAHS